ncbi:MAG: hypothetical protein ACD_75C01374G0002 [uncultured bacterium]|nr:MAG: hypothetical protein ACD_75C01374G0002 [uncultured bacterium]
MIGNRIGDYRRGLRYKVAEFAKLIGISQGSLSDIENNKTKPSAVTIEAIVRNTDINPGWLLTGVGPNRKGDFRTGDGRPFSSSNDIDQGEIDHDLMWNVVNVMQRTLGEMGIDSKLLSQDKRVIIQNLLYSDSKQKSGQVDEVYAGLLIRLTYCEECQGQKSKIEWQEKWGVRPEPGQDLEDVTIIVKTPPGLKCPMEGMPRKYITDSVPVTVHCTDYYRRLVDDSSLILVQAEQGTGPSAKRPDPDLSRYKVTQTVSGTGHKVAGRDILGEKEGAEK